MSEYQKKGVNGFMLDAFLNSIIAPIIVGLVLMMFQAWFDNK
jgi:hypothetical protein